MDEQLFLIFKFFKNMDDNNLYRFFINNYKNFDNIEDLIIGFLIENKIPKEDIKKIFENANFYINFEYIKDELEKYKYIIDYKKEVDIINILFYRKLRGEFIIFDRWFNNFFIIKDINTEKFYKILFYDDILDKVNINDLLVLEIVKNNKNFWTISKLIDFYPKLYLKIK